MTSRIARSLISLAAVTAAYAAYALFAVPWIEPAARANAGSQLTAEEHYIADRVSDRYDKLLSPYFPADHWARNNPKVLQSDEFMLLIRDFEAKDDQIELNPCLLLFFPPKRSTDSTATQQAVILDAPGGATLKFSDNMNLAKARIGRLRHGLLKGEVTIHSQMDDPGPEDDLLITTRNVQLTDSRIWTHESVDFRFGANRGSGDELEIRLVTDDAASPNRSAFGNLQSLQLVRNVKMHLAVAEKGLLPGSEPQPADRPAEKQQPPVEITSQGPFHFDLIRYVATFEDHVDVLRLSPGTASDQLTCEMLAVHFEGREPPAPQDKPADKPPQERLVPFRARLLEARGDPVIIRSPSTGAYARCQQLKYDLKLRKVSLDGPDEVMLHQHNNEIHAPALEYVVHADSGRLGSIWAAGPGWLRASADDAPDRAFDLRWQEQLELRRHDGVPVATVTGRPLASMSGMGDLVADEMHLWLAEDSQSNADSSQRFRLEPERLMAQGQVVINSQTLTGGVQRLEAWFETINTGPEFPTKQQSLLAQSTFASAQQQPLNQPRLAPVKQTSPKTANAFLPLADGGDNKQYDIRGQLMRLRVVNRNGKTGLADVSVEQQVVLREITTQETAEPPLLVSGDRLQVTNADTPDAHIQVAGELARLEARGMALTGRTIDMDQKENRAWIAGSGEMTLPMNRDLQGQPTGQTGTLRVSWQERMEFDGQRASFIRDVVAINQTQQLNTAQLDVTLQHPIRFTGGGNSQQAELRQIDCTGGVKLVNNASDLAESPSIDRMQAKTLRIDQVSGAIGADGPGWVSTVRPSESGQAGNGPLGGSALTIGSRGTTGATTAASDKGLEFLRVDFAGQIEGNFQKREMAFLRQVRTVYGPVAQWTDQLDARTVDDLDAETILLSCERLVVREMPGTVLGKQGTLELEAITDALVEGQTFTARADRMAYAQAKELLVLEGRSGNDARLWRQTHIGGPSSQAAARKILFWRATNRIEVDDARFFDLSQFGDTKEKK